MLALTPETQLQRATKEVKEWLNEVLAKSAPVTAKGAIDIRQTHQVRLYAGAPHALSEIVQGLIQMYPHKNTFCLDKSQSPYFGGLEMALARQAPSGGGTRRNSLCGEHMVVAQEDLFTGELFVCSKSYRKQKEQIWQDKGFVVEISTDGFSRMGFSDFFLKSLEVSEDSPVAHFPRHKYMFWVLPLAENLALGLIPANLQLPSLMAGGWWPREDFLEIIKKTQTKHQENRKQIEALEAEIVQFATKSDCTPRDPNQRKETSRKILRPPYTIKAPLLDKKPRIYDRLFLCLVGLSGDALRHQILQSVPSHLCTVLEQEIETADPCRWGPTEHMEWLHLQGYSLEEIRGSLVISTKFLRHFCDSEFAILFKNALKVYQGQSEFMCLGTEQK